MHTLTLTKLISGYNSGRNRSLRNYERKQSNEQVTDKSDKQDILLTGVNRLRREGKIHSNEVSEISDGFRTPDDSESVTSDIFGVPEFVKEGEESFNDRLARSAYMSNGRKSANKDPYEDKSGRYTSARPVARRSVSRELFDLKYNTGKISPLSYHSALSETETHSSALSPPSRRISRVSREGSSSRDSGDYSTDPPVGGYSRSISLSRGAGLGAGADQLTSVRYQPSRPPLSSSGRNGTQNEMLRSSPLTVLRYTEEDGSGLGSNLRDRKRDDWRRISVPERGKDFNSLPRKYSRHGKNSFI